MEAREAFLHAGGKEFRYVPCLNDQHEWISALCAIAQRHMGGWDTAAQPDKAQAEQSRARALQMGASR